MATYKCFFCGEDDEKPVTDAGSRRIQSSIIEVSKLCGDGIYINLEKDLEANDKLTIKCHRNCESTYTSKFQAIEKASCGKALFGCM